MRHTLQLGFLVALSPFLVDGLRHFAMLRAEVWIPDFRN